MAFVYKTVDGDALEHKHNPTGKLIIPQVNNDLGVLGAGIALGIAKKWPWLKEQHEDWYKYWEYEDAEGKPIAHPMRLGEVQFLEVDDDIFVANMVAQRDIGPNEFGMPPIRLDSLRECIFRLRKFIVENDVKSVASCKFGSLRAGGAWSDIEAMIKEIFHEVDVEWITYNYVEPSFKKYDNPARGKIYDNKINNN